MVFHLVYLTYLLKTFKYDLGKKWGHILEGQHRVATGAAAHTHFRFGQQPTVEDQYTHSALQRSLAASRCIDDYTALRV